jgi:protein O-mannosyl-transferase
MTNKKKQLLLIIAGLVIATIIAYEPIRHNDFVNYDDDRYIVENPNVKGGLTQQSIIWAFTKSSKVDYWIPITWISHMLDCQIFGPNPAGPHFVNLFLHITNALLLFWILNSITALIWPSAFVAAVFALHPLQVESVAWAAERKTVLSGLFWFLTMAVYIWYARRPGIGRYILLFGIYALSIMTKPVVVTLPFVLLLLDYWPLERLISKRSIIHSIVEKIPFLGLSGILAIITVKAQSVGGAIAPLERLPLASRIANTFISYIRYTGKMIWPSELAAPYPISIISPTSAIAIVCTILFAILLVLSIFIGRRKKYLATGWLWFVVTLVPMIGLIQVGSQAIADRYMYISMIGLLLIIAWGAEDITGKRLWLKETVTMSAVVILLITGLLTHMQVKYWRNNLTLFEHTLKVTKDNPFAENSYGAALVQKGRLIEAELHYRNAVRLDPQYFTARHNLGFILILEGKAGEAAACFEKLLQEGHNVAIVNLGLGWALGMQNKYEEAVIYFKESLRQDPGNLDTRQKLVNALMAMGETNKAILCLKESLQISPNQPQIYMMLGAIYEQTGDYKSAIANWTRVVEMRPDNANALNSLAWLLATTGEVSAESANKAVKLAEHSCELTGYKNAMILDTLAAAYAAAGRFDDAVNAANQAVEIAEVGGQLELANEIRDRAKLYKAGMRYRKTQKTNNK